MSLAFLKKVRMWSGVLTLSAGVGFTAAQALAQGPAPLVQAANGMPTKYLVKNTLFHLPFKVGQGAQANIREMHLWMRDETGEWKLVDRVAPSAVQFTCRAPHDGEYGFSIVTIDRHGMASPRDVTHRPPELIVVVDTRQGNATLPAVAPPSSPRPSPAAGLPNPSTPPAVKTSAASGFGETDVTALHQNAPRPSTPAEPVNTIQANVHDGAGMSMAPTKCEANYPFDANTMTTQIVTETIVPLDSTPAPIPSHSRMVRVAPRMMLVNEIDSTPVPAEITEALMPQEDETPAARPAATTDHPRRVSGVRLVNNTRVSIDYNVAKSGPSGLARVLIYGTSDQGRTWECLGEDADHHSPAEITLPGEGTYGVRIVGINGNGFGGKAPVAGDHPALTITVDLTKPKISSWKVGLAKNGYLDIHWKVSDENLGGHPVNLYYRTSRSGAWKPLAANLKSDGEFRWPITRDLATQYYVRLEATDLAGNIAACQTQNPILADRTEPDINVTGVNVIQTRPLERVGSVVPVAAGSDNDE